MIYFKLGALAAALQLVSSSATSLRASNNAKKTRRELTACNGYSSGTASNTITMMWTNSADGDTEWLNTNNYNYKHWPGLTKFNKVIMAVNDVGSVTYNIIVKKNYVRIVKNIDFLLTWIVVYPWIFLLNLSQHLQVL